MAVPLGDSQVKKAEGRICGTTQQMALVHEGQRLSAMRMAEFSAKDLETQPNQFQWILSPWLLRFMDIIKAFFSA